MGQQAPIFRAALVVAVGALLGAVVAPYLTVGYISPRPAIIAIVVAVFGLSYLQGVLLGFFGGILMDALGVGLFGVGALGGLMAGALSARVGAMRRKQVLGPTLAQVTAVSVAFYDVAYLAARALVGSGGPPLGEFLVAGVLPNALLNGLLAYLVGGWLLRFIRKRELIK